AQALPPNTHHSTGTNSISGTRRSAAPLRLVVLRTNEISRIWMGAAFIKLDSCSIDHMLK
ncbi:MAG TPA: hypothetical protein PKE17_20060, partial [Saprospiraceae bacterium]|nr:hypothetical protein [Saprospiraceae bacterium]